MTDRRQQILRAATELAAERGMSALSVRAVAARAGIGASTLRHYFPTQRALFDAVAGSAFDAQLSDLRIHDPAVPPRQRLAECLGQFLPASDADRSTLDQWLALHAAALDADRGDQAQHLLAVLNARGRERVDGWLATLEAEGVLRPIDRRVHATLLLAVVDGLCLKLLTPERTLTVAQARALLADAVTRLTRAA